MLKRLGLGTSWHDVKFIYSATKIDNDLKHSLFEYIVRPYVSAQESGALPKKKM